MLEINFSLNSTNPLQTLPKYNVFFFLETQKKCEQNHHSLRLAVHLRTVKYAVSSKLLIVNTSMVYVVNLGYNTSRNGKECEH